jgi:hypothetical protein
VSDPSCRVYAPVVDAAHLIHGVVVHPDASPSFLTPSANYALAMVYPPRRLPGRIVRQYSEPTTGRWCSTSAK